MLMHPGVMLLLLWAAQLLERYVWLVPLNWNIAQHDWLNRIIQCANKVLENYWALNGFAPQILSVCYMHMLHAHVICTSWFCSYANSGRKWTRLSKHHWCNHNTHTGIVSPALSIQLQKFIRDRKCLWSIHCQKVLIEKHGMFPNILELQSFG